MNPTDRDSHFPRREFLKAVAAFPAIATLASAADLPATRNDRLADREVDVAVIGAGLSGLCAARALGKAGLQACVLEARDRVGGRTFDHPIGNGNVVEGGGQWVGPGQTEVLALAKELGIETFDSYATGKTALYISGMRLTWGREQESADLRRVKGALDALAKEVPLDAPWTAPRAGEWDAMTVADWLKANKAAGQTIEDFTVDCETELGRPANISLLWYLFYLHAAGGHTALIVDAQKSRLKGGPQSMSRMMAHAMGDDVILSSPVSRITTGGAKAVVESARVRVTARRVIVAMMPADTRRIAFSPELPEARQGLVKAWTGEPAIKVNAVYPKPFWRDAGLSGLGVSDRGPVAVTFDNSPPDGSQGVLLAFLSEEHEIKNPSDRRKAVLEGFVHLFGKSAANPTDYVETDWSADPWTTGCVSPIGPRTLTRFGPALRAPAGLIHWAGTETSEIWCGYMDGAIRSGRRAAAEVLKAL